MLRLSRFSTRTVPAATLLAVLAAAMPGASALPRAEISRDSRVVQSADATSAMLAARTQNSRVEDLSARTATSATFANANGTWTTESYSGIVRSKVDEDTWVAIDPTVERIDGAFEPRATPIGVEYSDGGDRTVGVAKNDDGAAVEVGWPTVGSNPRQP